MKSGRILAALSAVCILTGTMASVPAEAVRVYDGEETERSGKCGENVTWELSADGKTLTISGKGEMRDDYSEVSLPEWGTSLRTVIVEEGVTTIGRFAFAYNAGLSSVTLPDSLEKIGVSAFKSCSNRLKTITLPPHLETIGLEAFHKCAKLETITLPDSVTSVDNHAFSGCKALTSAHLSAGMEKIPTGMFNQCVSLREVYIPDSIKSIGGISFYRCGALESVEIPDSVTFVGDSAFDSCTGLQSLRIPEGLTHIGRRAFKLSQSESAVSLNLRDTYENWIGDEAFLDCHLLTSYTVSAEVRTVSEDAFRNCANLRSLTFLNPKCELNGEQTTVCSAEGDDAVYTGTIYGYADSTARAYAEKYGYAFAEIGSEPPQTDTRGDFDSDGEISAKDAMNIIQIAADVLVGNEPDATEEQLRAADTDGDGEVTALDAQYTLIYFLENTVLNNEVDWPDIIPGLE